MLDVWKILANQRQENRICMPIHSLRVPSLPLSELLAIHSWSVPHTVSVLDNYLNILRCNFGRFPGHVFDILSLVNNPS
jgi:hypothetical protein